MSSKFRRLRGSGTHGRGYKSSKVKGGTGRAGYKTHKRFSAIVEQKTRLRSLGSTCIRDIESKLDRYIKKRIVRVRHLPSPMGPQPHYYFSKAFPYLKVLSQGEPTGVYHLPRHVKISCGAKHKTS